MEIYLYLYVRICQALVICLYKENDFFPPCLWTDGADIGQRLVLPPRPHLWSAPLSIVVFPDNVSSGAPEFWK